MDQFGTQVISAGGQVLMRSKNLRAMRDYARRSPVFRVIAHPCPKNPYNGRLVVHYENGSRSSAHFACYTVLLEWLYNRHSWRAAPFWQVEPPATAHLDQRAISACERLNAKGLF